MKRIIYARIYKGESQYVAECLDLAVVTQGKRLDEVTENLREAVGLHLDGEDLSQWELAPNPSLNCAFFRGRACGSALSLLV